eukprot:Nk52_evm1s494 gene=Nk52_evmTU1s494
MKQQALSLLCVLLLSMCILSCAAKSIKKDDSQPIAGGPPSSSDVHKVNGRLPLKLTPEHLAPTTKLFSERLAAAKPELPKNYDPREKYPQCFHIYNQQYCGSCWANAVAGAFSDRICLASKGKNTVQLSAADIMTGVTSVVKMGNQQMSDNPAIFQQNDASCSTGGFDIWGWGYAQVFGVVTGGNDGTGKGCVPYPISRGTNCIGGSDAWEGILTPNSHRGGCGPKGCPEQTCPKSVPYTSCTNKNYNTSYAEDKHYVNFVGAVDIPTMVEESTLTYEHYLDLVKHEIYANGSVSFGIEVPTDFQTFDFSKGQVYTKDHFLTLKEPRIEGGHAMRIIGW